MITTRLSSRMSITGSRKSDLAEVLSHMAEEQQVVWSKWMSYLFSICPEREDGTVVIPAEKVRRWKRQVETPFSELSESEKRSDQHVVLECCLTTLKRAIEGKRTEYLKQAWNG